MKKQKGVHQRLFCADSADTKASLWRMCRVSSATLHQRWLFFNSSTEMIFFVLLGGFTFISRMLAGSKHWL